jgi:hypothetical protein
MSDAAKARAVPPKPRREDYASDDDFGEAYVLWKSQQILAAAAAPAAPAPPPVAKRPAASAAKPRVTLPPMAPPLLPRQSEAEREAWNLSTKARFWRAKTSDAGKKT